MALLLSCTILFEAGEQVLDLLAFPGRSATCDETSSTHSGHMIGLFSWHISDCCASRRPRGTSSPTTANRLLASDSSTTGTSSTCLKLTNQIDSIR